MAEKLHYDASGSTFKEAFKEAREEGKKTFEWNGKRYSTEMESPKASMDSGVPKKDKSDEKVGKGYEDVGKEDKRNRGTAAALGAAAVGLGGAALLSGMKRSEQQRKDREMSKGKEDRSMKSPVRNISPEEAAFENEGGRYYKKGGKVKNMAGGGSASSRGDGIAQRGKTKGRMC
jgi:hypothetical protein